MTEVSAELSLPALCSAWPPANFLNWEASKSMFCKDKVIAVSTLPYHCDNGVTKSSSPETLEFFSRSEAELRTRGGGAVTAGYSVQSGQLCEFRLNSVSYLIQQCALSEPKHPEKLLMKTPGGAIEITQINFSRAPLVPLIMKFVPVCSKSNI